MSEKTDFDENWIIYWHTGLCGECKVFLITPWFL